MGRTATNYGGATERVRELIATGLTRFGGKLYFPGYVASTGDELWSTDGTAAGTRIVRDLYPGVVGSFPSDLIAADGRLYFQATSPMHWQEIWVLRT